VRAWLLASAKAPIPDRVRTTFAFIDMVASTPLVEALGDEAWTDLLSWYERTLRSAFETHGGAEVNQEGDGFFVTFDDPAAAIDCAVAIQQVLTAHRHDHGFAPRVRIGLHTADAHRRGDDYSGLAVHAAARIAGTAAPEEIVASAAALEGGDRRISDPRAL
jgi:class 3 adenylate cyclase